MKIPRWSLPGAVVIVVLLVSPTVHGWSNGPNGNATTDELEECGSPPYATHDWIADHALALLPDDEQVWLLPDIASFLLGTEAPDNDDIPEACNAPHTGYDDRRLGHSVEWNADWTKMVRDRAAVRAQEEYDKAALAYEQDDPVAAEEVGAEGCVLVDSSCRTRLPAFPLAGLGSAWLESTLAVNSLTLWRSMAIS